MLVGTGARIIALMITVMPNMFGVITAYKGMQDLGVRLHLPVTMGVRATLKKINK